MAKATAEAKPPAPRRATAKPRSSKTSTEPAGHAPAAVAQLPEARMLVSAEERLRMIAEAAYFRAEGRGFLHGDPVEDWLAAEADVDEWLRNGVPHH